jgi:hypothetical protein
VRLNLFVGIKVSKQEDVNKTKKIELFFKFFKVNKNPQ